MRSPACLSVVLGVAVLLALPALAVAGPKPILKPPDTTSSKTPAKAPAKAPTHAASTHTTIAPTHKPSSTSTSTGTSSTGTSSTGTSSTGTSGTSRTVTNGGTATVTPVVSHGSRVEPPAVVKTVVKTTTPPPAPTPLKFFSIGDRLRSHSTPTPAWKLALLALLAAAEAFLVVRLVRHRPGGGLTAA